MRKTILLALASLPLLAAPALAMDCNNMLDQISDRIGKMTKASGEKRAAMRRMAMLGYDYCMAGDTFNAEKFWKMLQDNSN